LASCSGEAVRVDDEGQSSLRDVRDHVLQVAERLSGYRELLRIL
jgi:Mg2+ and Co2+ transporter CorA